MSDTAEARQFIRLPRPVQNLLRDQRRRALHYLLYEQVGLAGFSVTKCGGCGLLNFRAGYIPQNQANANTTFHYCMTCRQQTFQEVVYTASEDAVNELEIYLKILEIDVG